MMMVALVLHLLHMLALAGNFSPVSVGAAGSGALRSLVTGSLFFFERDSNAARLSAMSLRVSALA
jgi:hypothetical protein